VHISLIRAVGRAVNISWIRAFSGKSNGCVTSVPVQRKAEWIFLQLQQWDRSRAVDVPLIGASQGQSIGY
jgi:hypothetical protein